MRNILFFLFLLVTYETRSQNRSLCDIPPELQSAYIDQVKSLALDQMVNSGSVDTNSIRILEPYYLPIFEALAAIYHSSFTEQVDTIFNIYCINNLYADESISYSSKAIYVKLDTTVNWTDSWENNTAPSGNPFIDSILFDIPYTVHTVFNNTRRLVFADVLNLATLVNLLDTLDGIIYAEQVPAIGDRSHIIHSQEDNDHHFQFILGWDDCPSGCISTRTWEFESNISTCDAQLVSVYGRPVTFWFNEPPYATYCNLKSSEFDPPQDSLISIYPNPVKDVLNITSEKTIHDLDIYDTMGTHIAHKKVGNRVIQENISYLAPGVYLLILDKEAVVKFIKS